MLVFILGAGNWGNSKFASFQTEEVAVQQSRKLYTDYKLTKDVEWDLTDRDNMGNCVLKFLEEDTKIPFF